ncbi:hypothetical protein BDN70DRAFT_553759 [Pholiota conissans]|uniref:DUF6534 domain-containing protein n=1 Tax=Pholiota conissans TaxID=109636 RepID=A0A9P5Z5K3_9AGAR|nr:hypothetical protein BDN70DRAFT_553759 [Pholiota conissans]
MSVDFDGGLELQDVGLTKHSTAGAILLGAIASYVLYGVASCQVLTYYWTFPKDPWTLKLHVACVWVSETVNVFLMTPAVWFYLIRRGADITLEQFIFCNDWTFVAQSVPTEVVCLLVEYFFILRMWRIADSKPMAIITTVPFLAGWGFNIAYCVGMFRLRCLPDLKANDPWLFSSYGSRILSDGLIAGTMCYMLWKKRPDSVWKTNTLRMISYLSLWALTTGLLMWMSAVAFIVSYSTVPLTWIPPAVYLLRGRIHSNTMFSVLNSRRHMRRLANESIPLQIHDTEVFGTSMQAQPSSDETASNHPSRRQQTYYVTDISLRDPTPLELCSL